MMMSETLPIEIDLLSTPYGEPLILAATDLPAPLAAVLFDHETREVGFEFAGGFGYIPCNVPVDDDHMNLLKTKGRVFVVSLDDKNKVSTVSVAQLFHQSIMDDDLFIPPYAAGETPVYETQAVLVDAKRAQPLNRVFDGAMASGGVAPKGVLASRGVQSPKTLVMSARLQHELNHELELRRQMAPNLAPRMAPPGLGPRSSGTPASAHLATMNLQKFAPKPPTMPPSGSDTHNE